MTLPPSLKRREISSLKSFYSLMEETRDVRRIIVRNYLDYGTVEPDTIESLRNALASLESIPGEGGKYRLELNGSRGMELDLGYETEELKRDILFLKQGEEALREYLAHLHPGFNDHVRAGVERLKGLYFHTFATDRDGTINNYCGRYRSSIQPAYNAVFLSRFARICTEHSIIITSAPLYGPGIVDVNVGPENTFIYAASKAREFLDKRGRMHRFPISDVQNQKIAELNRRLKEIVMQPHLQKFYLIGSGLQYKFGGATIARQDIGHSIPDDESSAFLDLIRHTVNDIDPGHRFFRIEDTGLDIEIMLAIPEDGEGRKDFEKGDGLLFIDRVLKLPLSKGPNLIGGDTASDLSMVRASMEETGGTMSIFVTDLPELEGRLASLCPDYIVVPAVDILVAILHDLSKTGRIR